MSGSDSSPRKAQLDKAEREHLEDVVTDLRELVEREIEYELEHQYDLSAKEGGEELSGEAETVREQLVEAIEYENPGEKSWQWAYDQYVTGVGYTLVNRLAALRCMEVRGFLDQPVTQIGDSGLTPAAEQVLGERFDVGPDDALIVAFEDACERLDDEIELLFDTSSPYTVLDIDPDLFEDAVAELNEIPDAVWRADDVLGWVYEYYNRPVVEALDAKNSLEPEDVGPANQFYTPHWVVRMLADNSLGKLYLEATEQEDAIPEPDALPPDERKNRLVTPEDSPSVPELCTYLIPDEEPGDAPEFDHPRELRVIDPACGSGHFLLYAFDILERIWWAETDLDRAEIPAKVLEHNLYGVDIDLRSCQLSAFNLYLKARTRAEEEEEEDGTFEMPNVGIVCADARVAEVEEAVDVLDEITGEGSDLREALDDIIETFQHTEALGSLLDVSGTLEEAFDASKTQTELGDYNEGAHQSLNSFLKALRRAVADRTGDSFGEQNLRSFLNLLVVLTQEYDTALMNPPYGSRGRMPKPVREYSEGHYEYLQEYYINFFEVCDRLVTADGRIGMLVPWSFLFNQTFESFRSDFIGERGSFDFLSEFGYGILDNATVGTVGTVVRSGAREGTTGTFIRLHDCEKGEKEPVYLDTAFGEPQSSVDRYFKVDLDEFDQIPGTPICYSLPSEVRNLHDTDMKIDPEVPGIPGEGIGDVKQGLATADNDRFLRKQWEARDDVFRPFTNAGGDVWTLPEVDEVINWTDDGAEVDRAPNSVLRNMSYQTREGLTWAYIKRTGRRFGYYPSGGLFGHASNMLFTDDVDPWLLLGALNSDVFHGIMLCLTPERKWESGYIGMLPWFSELENHDELRENTQKQYDLFVKQNVHNMGSPYYIGPKLLPEHAVSGFFYTHPHIETLSIKPTELFETADEDQSLSAAARKGEEIRRRRQQRIESLANEINEVLGDTLNINSTSLEKIRKEIFLRTVESPEDREVADPESIDDIPENFDGMTKDLLLHFTLHAVRESDDGIIPLSAVKGEDDLLTHIEAEFERVWGDHADARLAEVDDVLGSRSAAEEAYPNLRAWLEEDLFAYHVTKFDRTPILWQLTTDRLVSDTEGEGFRCLVDYHQLDEGVFDRLQNRYLDPRKELLRDRRNTANRRRNNDSLSSSEQSEAAKEYTRYQSGIEQIQAFEECMAELVQPAPRSLSDDNRETAAEAADRVAEFRDRTERRLAAVDDLAAMDDVDMGELFTGNFYGKIEDNRAEWIDALDDLETAFEAYAEDTSEPVEAHLYDLFDYFADDLLGSSHFASNGILYMTYYFEKLEGADQTSLDEGSISEEQRLISQLASDVDEYISLGENISHSCGALSSEISDEWADRALSEITTAGYQPNHKHGVAINITPLAEQQIVPKTVDDNVL
ncbi:BREX-5 system adenine-specific DNA-methyltransferase PglX [Halorubrum salsamenti]|uniref:BREX-5 system adenine-specific DNA-methyltransferase PglX n=1 Tax=Halorubrum salsamenti TaxID=2583990 RepID=UPI0011A2EB36|nr:BREX-5 system adenine-specific DNA-methyltransferase PglX [Halorubrum salsamenti]